MIDHCCNEKLHKKTNNTKYLAFYNSYWYYHGCNSTTTMVEECCRNSKLASLSPGLPLVTWREVTEQYCLQCLKPHKNYCNCIQEVQTDYLQISVKPGEQKLFHCKIAAVVFKLMFSLNLHHFIMYDSEVLFPKTRCHKKYSSISIRK